ncbi:uncharacterized protein LOC135926837 [Gordionus sp. m RMFG-2023]|uniref:uncharacterized protein LOC135926837 n=1 Tax=Gordionus sp. m RMFG-2023 TaxID=3053472 RepID=UPI0031FC4B95
MTTEGPPRNEEIWWWNPEVAKALDEKQRCFKEWYNSKENNELCCAKVEDPGCKFGKDEIKRAEKKMKKGKASDLTMVVSEMFKDSDDSEIEWLMDLVNQIVAEELFPRTDVEVFERALEKRIRKQTKMDEMQFGFTSGKGTTDAIFMTKFLRTRCRSRVLDGLEKIRCGGMVGYGSDCNVAGAHTAVRMDDEDSESFKVKIGLHQGSVLSSLLFILVMDVVAREMHEGLPWELLFADVVLMANSERELRDKISQWKMAMKAKGLEMNAAKTKG